MIPSRVHVRSQGWRAAIAAVLSAGSVPAAAADATVPPPVSSTAGIILVGDTIVDPGFTPDSAADSPTESSGAFDATRGDLGEDDDLSVQKRPRRPRLQSTDVAAAAAGLPDPLAGTPRIDPAATGGDAERILATMLPPRSDVPRDWQAAIEPLHDCGEPRALPACVPPPPCHPAEPPAPFDLVGVSGVPSCGPIYRGPCQPRSATVHEGPLRWYHALHDRFFDVFYKPR